MHALINTHIVATTASEANRDQMTIALALY